MNYYNYFKLSDQSLRGSSYSVHASPRFTYIQQRQKETSAKSAHILAAQ